MNDDRAPEREMKGPPPRTPNRASRRAPPVIEGEAVRRPEGSSAPGDESSQTPPSGADTPEQTAAPASESPAPEATPELTPETAPEAAPQAVPDPAAVGAPVGAPVEPNAADPAAAAQPDAARATSEPEPAAPAPRRGYGFGAIAATSLASAGLAALAVYGVQTAAAPDAAPVAGLEQRWERVDAVEKRVGAVDALEKRVGEVEQRAAASAQAPQVSPAALAALEKRVASAEALATNAAEIARKAAQPAPPPAPGASSEAGAFRALDQRLAAVEKALAAPKTDERATQERVEPAPPPPPPPDIEPLRQQITALEQRLQRIERETAPLSEAARAAGGQISALQESIQPLAQRVDEARALMQSERKRAEDLAQRSAEAARLALAQSVAAAVESGEPFAAQVDALERLGAPAERLGPLRDVSANGVATRAELTRSLAALEPKIVTWPQTPPGASIVDRLTNSALGLVRVTPAGDPAGDAPADVFARMLRLLQRGDVAGALAQRGKLPDDAKAASAEWAQRAQARVEAEQAARAILSDQTQKLGRS